jgi:hypothetical protein
MIETMSAAFAYVLVEGKLIARIFPPEQGVLLEWGHRVADRLVSFDGDERRLKSADLAPAARRLSCRSMSISALFWSWQGEAPSISSCDLVLPPSRSLCG